MMNNSTATPVVSLIVPVYKSEATLGACLDSLLAQTEADIEIVCVNDGSPDNCAGILESYAARDARIRVIAQENQGLSAARNAGMDVARGRIIDFVDSDDTAHIRLCLDGSVKGTGQNLSAVAACDAADIFLASGGRQAALYM